MTKTRAALIVLTSPKDTDISDYWSFFFHYPYWIRNGNPSEEIRAAALSYLENKIDGD